VVESSIQNNCRNNVILENISPRVIRFVGSKDNGRLFISPEDQLGEAMSHKLIK
jgi:hypothetical protein